MTVLHRLFYALAAIAVLGLSPAWGDMSVKTELSPGGLRFRHVLVPEQPMQVIHFAWPDSRAMTFPGKEALAFLGPALVLEGPEGMSPSAMIEELRDLQAATSLSSSGWNTRGSISAPASKFTAAADLLRRTLMRPALSQARLRARQGNALARLRQELENPETIARRVLTRLTLGDSPQARLSIGDDGSYEKVTREDIADWAKATFTRTGLEIVVAGPIDPEAAGRVVDDLFHGLPEGEPKAAPAPSPLRQSGKLVVLTRPVVQTVIAMAAPTSLPVNEHSVRADMLMSILAGGLQSRMYRSVRERLGAAYGVSAALNLANPAAYVLSIRSLVANDGARDALAAMSEDYARFVSGGVTSEEVDAQRSRRTANRAEALRRPGNVAAIVLNAILNGWPNDALATYASRMASYPISEFNADLSNYFPRPPLTTVVVAPSADGWGADCVISSIDEAARCD